MSEVLTLKDDVGRTLTCELLQEIPLDDKIYGLVLPQGTPVRVMAWIDTEDEDEPTLEDLDDEEIAKVLPTARAVLEEQELKLLDSAFVLVVTGDVPEADEDSEVYTISEDEEEEEEDYQLVSEFFVEERHYAVFSPVDPLFLFVDLTEAPPRMLSPEETKTLMPMFEDALFENADNG
ncbi:DUF3727 domain-containing protein [Candidatus Cyanaurora vandensis]|uniref:DUF3727 domain-containing protein n=1 Tax=Candidatus Cyanaurora vandensis TaxID=2714958 RepID=UPI0025797702|nr:DUF3727 domain-containing protein [Candidatus Cyanaurora vandensis]